MTGSSSVIQQQSTSDLAAFEGHAPVMPCLRVSVHRCMKDQELKAVCGCRPAGICALLL